MNVTLTKEEAQQVLEYVECVPDDRLNVEHIDRDALVETLRARLAEPPERVTKEMLQAQVNALIALQKIQDSRHEREARLAEPEKKQEPVAWCIVENGRTHGLVKSKPAVMNAEKWQPLYTAPPQRPWQGLTEQESGAIMEELNAYGTRLYEFARAIEQALKEKNK